MPPIMGAAALVMADFISISYLTIIIAAIVPALAAAMPLFSQRLFLIIDILGVEVAEH